MAVTIICLLGSAEKVLAQDIGMLVGSYLLLCSLIFILCTVEVSVTPDYLNVVEGSLDEVELCASINSSDLMADETVVISLSFENSSYGAGYR